MANEEPLIEDEENEVKPLTEKDHRLNVFRMALGSLLIGLISLVGGLVVKIAYPPSVGLHWKYKLVTVQDGTVFIIMGSLFIIGGLYSIRKRKLLAKEKMQHENPQLTETKFTSKKKYPSNYTPPKKRKRKK